MRRRVGRWALAGALLVGAAACSDDDDDHAEISAPTTQAPTVTTTAATAVPSVATTTATVDATTTVTATIPARASFPDDAGAIEGIAATTFQYPGAPVTAEEAHCISDGLVHVFGRTRVEELGFGIGPWTLLGFALALGPWDRADSEAVVDTFRVCSPHWELLAIMSSTQGADMISIESARCVADALPDDQARELFVNGLVRPPGLAEDELRAQAAALYRSCLTPAEFAGMDFG